MVVVGIIMGSDSDFAVMQAAADVLKEFEIDHEVRIVSAHRTPDIMDEYAKSARERGLKVIIAGAGGSAHLPGMTASHTTLPVIGVPIKSNPEDHEALWSNIKMPPGVPLAVAPENGAKNAALLAVEILALSDDEVLKKYEAFREKQHAEVVQKDNDISKRYE